MISEISIKLLPNLHYFIIKVIQKILDKKYKNEPSLVK